MAARTMTHHTRLDAMWADAPLTLAPQQISDSAWYYEEVAGVCLIAYTDTREVCEVRIPWAMLRRSLARKDKRRQPRKATR